MAEYKNKIRSKKLIKEAFLELLYEKKNINKISVKEIIERAEISKSTFYAHYLDLFSLIEEYENEMFDFINKTMDEYLKSHSEEFLPYISKVIQILKQNEEIYKMIFNGALADHFINKLKLLFIERLNKDLTFKTLSNEPKKRMAEINFTINAVIYTILDYFKGSLKINLDEIAILINEILLKLIK